MTKHDFLLAAVLVSGLLPGCGGTSAETAAFAEDPAKLLSDPALLAEPGSLALANGRTSPVYVAKRGEYQFNLHSYLTRFDGKFWAIWSSGLTDEDSNGQVIRYASSEDGHQWSEGKVLAADPDGDGPGSWIARGVFVAEGRMTALLAYFEARPRVPGGPPSWPGLRLMRYECDGTGWSEMGLFADDCMNNYPPRKLGEKWFMTCRDTFRKMYTAQSPDLANGNWTITPLPLKAPQDNMSEPSWYLDPEGLAHLIFRDQGRSGYLRQSVSSDFGATWTPPVLTNYPDATSKNFTGRLSNGWYFLINNPRQKGRDPLAITFSRDGWTFSNPLALRKDAPAQRFAGRSKGPKSFQYPHAIEHGGSLWVIYSTNKEDIEISEFPISDLGLGGE